MTDANPQSLKERVDAAWARNEERAGNFIDRAGEAAIDAKDKVTAFAKEHPVATVAGGIVVGILIAGLFRGPRQAAVKGGGKIASLATVGAELALAYAVKALEAAEEGGKDGLDWLSEASRLVGRNARELGGEAAEYAGEARDAVIEGGKSVGEAIRERLN
ncbi:hypothetical protein GRI89_04520 [Altererythrobacter salegens]|uniref:DUF883 domain-containing protein n=1 Tax=Croceibacterium salegens TaxID=1737568 RepID=A0A6I4SSA5_9SPHN|nr:hypothetical protein [Croceibacterium salegens]MXO58804.1 hypothetical protein [Croceibacterium salegens]